MKNKSENYFENADMLLNQMIKISGMSQNMFAEKVLEVKGPSVTSARNTKKIPERWFRVFEEKYGVTKEELCETPEEKLVRTYGKDGRRPVTSSIQSGWKNEEAQPAASQTGCDPDPRTSLARYEPLIWKMQHILDFIIDTYEYDPVATNDAISKIESALKKEQDYQQWTYFKREQAVERVKKLPGKNNKDGILENESSSIK